MAIEELKNALAFIDHCDDITLLRCIQRYIDYRIYCINHPGFEEQVIDKLLSLERIDKNDE